MNCGLTSFDLPLFTAYSLDYSIQSLLDGEEHEHSSKHFVLAIHIFNAPVALIAPVWIQMICTGGYLKIENPRTPLPDIVDGAVSLFVRALLYLSQKFLGKYNTLWYVSVGWIALHKLQIGPTDNRVTNYFLFLFVCFAYLSSKYFPHHEVVYHFLAPTWSDRSQEWQAE